MPRQASSPSTTIRAITSFTDLQETINSSRPCVIYFWATWCGPCKVVGPKFEESSGEAANEAVEFRKVDVGGHSQIMDEVGVKALPTFMLFCDGREVETEAGAIESRSQALVAKATTLV